ncbi:MAG: DUF3696 domain-containing protein [Planctomycetota bacterium]
MRLAPLTGLFGTNSSGKSSILQFLLMLKQTADSPDRAQVLYFGEEKSEKSLAVLGTFDDVLHKSSNERRLTWTLEWKLPKALKVADPQDTRKGPIMTGAEVELSCEVEDVGGGQLVVREMAYSFASHRFSMCSTPAPDRDPERKSAARKYSLNADGGAFHFERGRGGPLVGLPPPIKCYGFPPQIRAAYSNAGFLSDLEYAFEQQMQRVFYLGPLREYPFRDYRWSGAEPIDMGRRGEKVVSALLAAKQRGAMVGRGRGRKSLEEKVAAWLKNLGLIHDFGVEEIKKESNLYRVFVQRSSNSARVLLPDVGFGVSQVLPVIVLCYYVPEGSTILLEQPEIHLHPKVQEGLADVLIDAVKSRKVQVLIESHSEHLLRRLQRRIAEETFKPEDAALYFCDAKNGASDLVPLDVTMYGEIRNWPTDFFGSEFDELAKCMEAKLKRMQSRPA